MALIVLQVANQDVRTEGTPQGERGGYSGFQVTGMIKGFFGGSEIFDFEIFWVGKFGSLI